MKPFKETKAFEIIKSVIPGLATDIIGGIPIVGGPISSVLKSVLQKHDNKEIELTPDQYLALQTQLTEIEKLENEDKANARSREIEMTKAGSKNYTQNALAFVAVAIFIFIVVFVLARGLKDVPPEVNLLIGTIIGAAIGICKDIYAYYFGSSKGSADKTDLINKMNQN